MQATTPAKKWHVAQWGLWGWIETVLKLIGIGAGLLAFVGALSADGFILGGNPRLAAVILSGILSLLTVLIIAVRFSQREVISLGFAVMNAVGHIGLWVALLRTPDMRTLPLVFGVFYVLGELSKQRFLSISGFTEAGQTTSAMLRISRGILAIYVLLLAFLLI